MPQGQRRRAEASPSSDAVAIAAIALLGALAAAGAEAAPTGLAIWDVILRGLFAAVVIAAASKAPRWPVLVMAVIAAGGSSLSVWAVLAWVALALAVAASAFGRRNRVVSAVSAALAVQALLRLPGFGFFGLQSLLALVAVGPLLILGYRYSTRRLRNATRWAVGASFVAVLLLGFLGGLSLLNARTEVNQAVAAARRGLTAARAGDTLRVAQELDRAELSFREADDHVSSLFARGLRLIPVAAQHYHAVDIAVEQGSVAAGEAAAAVREADIRNLRLTAGSLDLTALSQMAPRLRSTSDTLSAAAASIESARSPWLIAPVEQRFDDLLDEVQRLRPEIELGARAAEVVPGMLGAERPQTYFVIFATPAESRELGGFLGSWALVSFDNGALRLGESGRVQELYETAATSQVAPGSVSDWYLEMARPTQFPQNLPSSPDMKQVANVSRQVLAGATDVQIDGFIYADGFALRDLLQVSGPVTIPFQEDQLSGDNAFQFFFEDQYRIEEIGRTEVFDQLAAVAGAVIDRIGVQTLPGPEELGRVLGPAARGGHLQVVTFDETTNDFLRSVQLLRDFGRSETSDFVGLVQTNGLSNKMDLYLQRTLDYKVAIIDDSLVATATARLRSVVPEDAPEFTLGFGDTIGLNRVLLSLYTPHALTGTRVNGMPAEHRATREFELDRYLVDVTLPPTGEEFVVEFDLVGLAPQGESYSLEVWHQPLVNTDQVDISYNGPDGEISWQGSLVENLVLRVGEGEN